MREKNVQYNQLKQSYGLDGNYINRLVNNPEVGVGHNYAKKICEAFGKPLDYLDRPIESDEQVRSAVYIPVLAFEEVSDYLKSGEKRNYEQMPVKRGTSEDSFCVVHEGISMEPKYKAGWNLIVDPTVSPETGDNVLATVEENVMVRSFAKEGRKSILTPANATFDTITIGNQDDVMGVIIGHIVYY